MRILLATVTLACLVGCATKEEGPPPLVSNTPESDIPKPSIESFHRAISKIDRIRISYPRLGYSVSLDGEEKIGRLKMLMLDRVILPSFTPAMLDLSQPMITAYHGSDRLFELRWQHSTKFQIVESSDESFAGSYVISPEWYQRYLAFCEEFKKKPNQLPEPTSGLAPGRGSS